jgi:hypothetical protein
VGASAWGRGGSPRRSAACRPCTRRRAGCDLQGSEPNHQREDAESGSSSRPSTGFGGVRGRTRSRPLEGPHAGGEPLLAERLSHPSWPCTAARRTARSPRASAVSRLGTSARPLPAETPLPTDFHVQRSPFRRGSPAWSPLPAPRRGAFGNGLPPPLRVPSSWFFTTSTVSSSRPLRGCCTALPTVGFGRSYLLAKDFPPPLSTLRSFPSAGSRRPSPLRLRGRVHRSAQPSQPSRDTVHLNPPPLPTTDRDTRATWAHKALLHLRVR